MKPKRIRIARVETEPYSEPYRVYVGYYLVSASEFKALSRMTASCINHAATTAAAKAYGKGGK